MTRKDERLQRYARELALRVARLLALPEDTQRVAADAAQMHPVQAIHCYVAILHSLGIHVPERRFVVPLAMVAGRFSKE